MSSDGRRRSARRVVVLADNENAERIERIGRSMRDTELLRVTGLDRSPRDCPIVCVGEWPSRKLDGLLDFRVRASITDDQLEPLLTALAAGTVVRVSSPVSEHPHDGDAFTESCKIGRVSDLLSAEAFGCDSICALTSADRAHLYFYDSNTTELWSEAEAGDDRYATAGLVGWSARTGLPCFAAHASADPRYERAIDDPQGDGSEQLLVQPVVTDHGRVHAVLVAIRTRSHPVFSDRERTNLSRYASFVAPLLEDMALRLKAEGEFRDVHEALFRERVQRQESSPDASPDVEVGAGLYYGVLALVAASALLCVCGRVAVYSTGVGFVRANDAGRLELVAFLPAEDGPRVAPGMALRLELSGRRYDAESVKIETVSRTTITMNEASRMYAVSGLQGSGRFVLVRGTFAQPRGRYCDGLVGNAEVHIGDERIISAMLRGLRSF